MSVGIVDVTLTGVPDDTREDPWFCISVPADRSIRSHGDRRTHRFGAATE
jgi:hypothetical protein